MPVYDTSERLRRLINLRDRINTEINLLLAEQQRRAQAHQAAAERARLTRDAPTPAVRAWARTQGIPVSDVGVLPLSLREQYINRTTNQEAGTP